jgi:hypothetical protein
MRVTFGTQVEVARAIAAAATTLNRRDAGDIALELLDAMGIPSDDFVILALKWTKELELQVLDLQTMPASTPIDWQLAKTQLRPVVRRLQVIVKKS